VDTHKRSHTLVAVDAGTGGVLGERTVVASDDGALAALRSVVALTRIGFERSRIVGRCQVAWSERSLLW
jgi:hypothetical protein